MYEGNSKPNLNRVIMDSMLIVLFLGLLALPILSIGMTGYKGDANVLGVEVEEVDEANAEEDDAQVEIKTFKMRVVPQDNQSTQPVHRMTEDF